MEREILFRGKLFDGEWIEGVPISNDTITCIFKLTDGVSELKGFQVNPSTVGQYTGLTDKNGRKIFEGDIISHYKDLSGSERLDVGVINYDEDHCVWYRTSSKSDDYPYIWKSCVYEVIGNIHDNPEMLGGEDLK